MVDRLGMEVVGKLKQRLIELAELGYRLFLSCPRALPCRPSTLARSQVEVEGEIGYEIHLPLTV